MPEPDKKTVSRIVLATGNQGKVREMSQLLSGLALDIVPQSEFDVPPADETGLTFIENAIIKARNAAHYTGLPAIADDSGIEVDALQGAPGIYSSRYAGVSATDEQNREKLLADLQDIDESERTARFQCVIVYMQHENDPTPLVCQSAWEGRILFESLGTGGFGYDPVFYVPTHCCTSAELPKDEKNRISHRGQALQKLLASLKV